MLARFPQIVARLSCILERFLTTLDCVDVAFIGDETLDRLPLPSRVGRIRVAGIDLNNPRMRAALSAVLALGPSPMGFGVARFRAKVHSMTGQSEADYTQRHATYDLKKLRGKDLITKMGRSRRYEVSTSSMHAITALQVLRHHVVRPVLAGVQRDLGPALAVWRRSRADCSSCQGKQVSNGGRRGPSREANRETLRKSKVAY